jgi:7-cyano-7-deazaguanine synthase
MAAFYARVLDADEVYLGILGKQMEEHPFTLSDFLEQLGDGLSKLQWQLPKFQFQIPFAKSTKSEVITLGAKIGVPFSLTWSCLEYGELHCGKCQGCVERRKGFADAGIVDATGYVTE